MSVRSGVRTHALIRGPERSPATGGKANLESGALDHSAILTWSLAAQPQFADGRSVDTDDDARDDVIDA